MAFFFKYRAFLGVSDVSSLLVSSCVVVWVVRGTQREYSSKPLKHTIVERILVFKR